MHVTLVVTLLQRSLTMPSSLRRQQCYYGFTAVVVIRPRRRHALFTLLRKSPTRLGHSDERDGIHLRHYGPPLAIYHWISNRLYNPDVSPVNWPDFVVLPSNLLRLLETLSRRTAPTWTIQSRPVWDRCQWHRTHFHDPGLRHDVLSHDATSSAGGNELERGDLRYSLHHFYDILFCEGQETVRRTS